jgi:biotin carboxyl carrier protein
MATQRLVISGKEYVVELGPRAGNVVQVTVNGRSYGVEIELGEAAGGRAPRQGPPPHASSASGGGQSGEVRAPISGVVLNIAVQPGQKVKAGSLVLVLEAMKMENEIFAPLDGTVESVLVKPQQEVRQGDVLVQIKGIE